jgi:hypothetical protein
MIIGTHNTYRMGEKIQVIGPQGRIISGVLPAIVIGFATEEEYVSNMKADGFEAHIASPSLRKNANFYKVSVD